MKNKTNNKKICNAWKNVKKLYRALFLFSFLLKQTTEPVGNVLFFHNIANNNNVIQKHREKKILCLVSFVYASHRKYLQKEYSA